jgi:hypothetical protein
MLASAAVVVALLASSCGAAALHDQSSVAGVPSDLFNMTTLLTQLGTYLFDHVVHTDTTAVVSALLPQAESFDLDVSIGAPSQDGVVQLTETEYFYGVDSFELLVRVCLPACLCLRVCGWIRRERLVSAQVSIIHAMTMASTSGNSTIGDAVVSYINRFSWENLMTQYAVGSGISGGLGAGIGFSIQCNSKVLFSFGTGVGGGISSSG